MVRDWRHHTAYYLPLPPCLLWSMLVGKHLAKLIGSWKESKSEEDHFFPWSKLHGHSLRSRLTIETEVWVSMDWGLSVMGSLLYMRDI